MPRPYGFQSRSKSFGKTGYPANRRSCSPEDESEPDESGDVAGPNHSPEKELERCHSAALNFLGVRSRSAAEVRERLAKRQFSKEAIESTIVWLTETGLLDDAAFAEAWTATRGRLRPSGSRLVKRELLAKGIDRELAAEAVSGIDEDAAAMQAGEKYVRRLHSEDEQAFRRRLQQHLLARGFNFSTIEHVVQQLWARTKLLDTISEP
jgi:regulatory protein